MQKISQARIKIGSSVLEIPYWVSDVTQSAQVVVTAGMDGDEYAGIEAAWQLIDWYAQNPPVVPIAIVPIVNLPGFYAACSHNPQDNKLPKSIFPGKQWGSPTEQLIHWLDSSFISKAQLWLDLHSGALTENLSPFVWSGRSGVKVVDERIQAIVASFSEPVLYELQPSLVKVGQLARRGTAYILFESGEGGKRTPVDRDRHVNWVRRAIDSFVLPQQRRSKQVYQQLHAFVARKNGMWYPATIQNNVVKTNDLLGEVFDTSGKGVQKVVAQETGRLLWYKNGLAAQKGDTLVAYATKQSLL